MGDASTPRRPRRVLAALRDYLDGRRPEYALEFRLRHKNGTYRWIYTRGVVLRDPTGRQTHVIGCHLDITDRKQLVLPYSGNATPITYQAGGRQFVVIAAGGGRNRPGTPQQSGGVYVAFALPK